MIFIEYPACGTCQKARKWLTERGITVHTRHIVEEPPTENELKEWIKRSGLPIKKFFNTSGLVYRELELKDRLPTMSTEDQIALLSSNGKLVKRPLLSRPLKFILISDIQQIILRISLLNLQVFLSS